MTSRILPTRHLSWHRIHSATRRLLTNISSGRGANDVDSTPRGSSKSDDDDEYSRLYLHVGPCGDFWTGRSIFAAKHLQPGYVKSVELDKSLDVDALLELLEEGDDNGDDSGGDASWTRMIYDEGTLPSDLLDRMRVRKGEKETLRTRAL